jgi:hypothetical protein
LDYDNPAYRLLSILEHGRTLKPETRCRECWDQLLGTNGDYGLLAVRLGKTMGLPREVRDAIKGAYPSQAETLGDWESGLVSAFSVQNLHGEWKTFITNVNQHTINYLRMASDMLHSKAGAKQVQPAAISAVRVKISEALDAVLASDSLDSELRLQISRVLNRILQTLDEYRITGVKAIADACDMAIGHAATNKRFRTFLNDPVLGAKVFEAISAAANLTTVALGLPQLQVAAAGILGLP